MERMAIDQLRKGGRRGRKGEKTRSEMTESKYRMIYPRSCVLALESRERERGEKGEEKKKRGKKGWRTREENFQKNHHTQTGIYRHWRTRGIARIADCSSIWLSRERRESERERDTEQQTSCYTKEKTAFLFAGTDNLEDSDRKKNKEKSKKKKKKKNLLWTSASTMTKKKKRTRRTNLSFLGHEHRSPLRYFIRSSLVEKWKKMTCPSFSSCFDRRRNTYWSFFLFLSRRSFISLSFSLALQLSLIFARRNLLDTDVRADFTRKVTASFEYLPSEANNQCRGRTIEQPFRLAFHILFTVLTSLREEIFLGQRKEKIMSNRFSFARLLFLFLVLFPLSRSQTVRVFFRSPLSSDIVLVVGASTDARLVFLLDLISVSARFSFLSFVEYTAGQTLESIRCDWAGNSLSTRSGAKGKVSDWKQKRRIFCEGEAAHWMSMDNIDRF